MSSEIALNKPRLVRTGNCFASSVCTIIENLYPNQPLDPLGLKAALPYPNEHFFTKLAGLLKLHGLVDYPVEIINVPNDKKIMIDVVIAALQGGALCELGVWGQKWINNVRKNEARIDARDQHSIVVYGYYQPDSKRSCWLYIFDPFDGKLIFKEATEVYYTQITYAKKIFSRNVWSNVNLFGLCFDHSNLRSRFQPNEDQINAINPSMILDRLFGENEKEKLSTVLAIN